MVGCGELGRWRAEEGRLSAFDVTLYVDDIYSSNAFHFFSNRHTLIVNVDIAAHSARRHSPKLYFMQFIIYQCRMGMIDAHHVSHSSSPKALAHTALAVNQPHSPRHVPTQHQSPPAICAAYSMPLRR